MDNRCLHTEKIPELLQIMEEFGANSNMASFELLSSGECQGDNTTQLVTDFFKLLRREVMVLGILDGGCISERLCPCQILEYLVVLELSGGMLSGL